FSFTTLTTTGYGNYVPAGNPGQSFAVAEMLIGQLFLVIAVAKVINAYTPLRLPDGPCVGTQRLGRSGGVAATYEVADGVGDADGQRAEGKLAQARAQHGPAGQPTHDHAASDQGHRRDSQRRGEHRQADQVGQQRHQGAEGERQQGSQPGQDRGRQLV